MSEQIVAKNIKRKRRETKRRKKNQSDKLSDYYCFYECVSVIYCMDLTWFCFSSAYVPFGWLAVVFSLETKKNPCDISSIPIFIANNLCEFFFLSLFFYMSHSSIYLFPFRVIIGNTMHIDFISH